MAIPKSEAARTFTEQQRLEFVALENKIDEKIRSDYKGSGITVSLSRYPNEKVRAAIIEKYREVGWQVRFEDDQREGTSVFLY